MANQIAIKVHTQPGDEILVGQSAHNWLFESGAAPVISGVQVTRLPGDGRFDAAAVRAAFKPEDDHHLPPTRLVSIENTHNMAGGAIWDLDSTREIIQLARDFGMAMHLDGARLWNAAARLGLPEAELARGYDTVSVCLSKGLGAPAGSLLAGSQKLIHRARRVRKMLGGAMRQGGILAAAGLYAIDHNRGRLRRDHENAAFLARQIAGLSHPGLRVAIDRVQTNIVMVDVSGDAPSLTQRARERGLLMGAVSPTRIRLVTHLDVDRAACARAVEILAELVDPTSGVESRAGPR